MKRNLEMFVLGCIIGIIIMINIYLWVLYPKIESRFEIEVVDAKVAEFYYDGEQIKFRFLTDHKK